MLRNSFKASRLAFNSKASVRSFSSTCSRFNEPKTQIQEDQAIEQDTVIIESPEIVAAETVITTATAPSSSSNNVSIKNIIRQTVKSRPFAEVAAGAPKLSADVEKELNTEFHSLVNEFVTNADLSSAFSQLNPPQELSAGRQHNARSGSYVKKADRYEKSQFPNIRSTEANEPYSSQELFLRRQHQAKVLGNLGSSISDVYRPHEDVLKPPSAAQTSIETLLAAGVHLGHSVEFLRASTQPYLYGIRDGIHIIDLESTLVHLRRAARVAQEVAEQGGLILYVGTRPGQQRSLEEAANRSGGYYVHNRWVAGTLTNCRVVSDQWERIEVDMGDNLTGRMLSPNVKRSVVKPDLVVLLNPVENRNAIYECIKYNIPTIGIVDTNSEPSLLTYPIPGNDDSIRATDLIVGVVSKAAQKGRNMRLKAFSQRKKEIEAATAAAAASAQATGSIESAQV